ncbi:MAG: hypothetical protein ABI282_11310 [Candidatus Baltobacteraceae bacterium]
MLEALAVNEVDYVLIGGLAAAFHGTTRITRDIDIAYATHRANLERICRVMNAFEPRRVVLGKPEGGVLSLTPEILKRNPALRILTTVGEIDMLDKIEGFATYGLVKTHAQAGDIGFPVIVLSIEGLIKTKTALKRPKDTQDIVELEAIREAQSLTNSIASTKFRLD